MLIEASGVLAFCLQSLFVLMLDARKLLNRKSELIGTCHLVLLTNQGEITLGIACFVARNLFTNHKMGVNASPAIYIQ
jgi:hypothetical protein